ncbi:MAG: tetratricopeptide repeat protein [Flavobacteriales bacterium]|nr:tetratricopeptide repeat protein [Flavobacteriales bacterium]MCC6939385.1 tetratricopeptide repeat protein [Flavobacteriales bacterium]
MTQRSFSFLRRSALIGVLMIGANASHGQSVQILLIRGDSLLDVEKPQRALEVFDAAVKRESTAATLLGRARAYKALDRNERFIQDVDKALKLDSTSGEGHFQRGLYSFTTKDYEKAEYHGGRAITYARNNLWRARSHNLRGEARSEAGKVDLAIEDLEAARSLGREDVASLRTLARLYDMVSRHEDALAVLERLCDLEPNDPGHWTNKGYELTMVGRYEDALAALDRALAYDPDEPIALSNKAYTYMKMERNDDAWITVERSLKNYPSNPHALRTRAILRLRKGERIKACEDLGVAKALGDVPEVDELIKENCATPGGVR